MKKTLGTVTTDGVVPHQMDMRTGILCPVMVDMNPKGPKHLASPIKTIVGKLYALPGGGSFVA